MALETNTYTYEQVKLPTTELTVTTDTNTGETAYTCVVNLLEIDPVRSTSAEERAAGITSLNPPTVRVLNDPQMLINTCVRACGSGIDATDGVELSPLGYGYLSMYVPLAVLGALRLAGVDV